MQVRPSTVQGAGRPGNRGNTNWEYPLVPLRTRYFLTTYQELPGWRSQHSTSGSEFNVTALRPTSFGNTRGNQTLLSASQRIPSTLPANFARNVRLATHRSHVSPREIVLPVEPVQREVRRPESSAWVQRNLGTVPRLHMHMERLDGGLPPLTAPSILEPSLQVQPTPLTEEPSTQTSDSIYFPRNPAEITVIYGHLDSSQAVEDHLIPLPPSISLLSHIDENSDFKVPIQIITKFCILKKAKSEVEWIRKEVNERVVIIKSPSLPLSLNLPEEQPLTESVPVQVSVPAVVEDMKEGATETVLSHDLSLIPLEQIPVNTEPTSEAQTERLALFRELFEGRPITRSKSFTSGMAENEQKSLFDVFMLGIKRGAIRSREQAESFIKDELKDSLVSDMGLFSRNLRSPEDSTRPSYFLYTADGAEQGSLRAMRRRERNHSVIQHPNDPVIESPRLIHSSDLKLRPRFADLTNVAVELPLFEASQSRGFLATHDTLPLVEQSETEKTVDAGLEAKSVESEPKSEERTTKKTEEIKEKPLAIPVKTVEKPDKIEKISVEVRIKEQIIKSTSVVSPEAESRAVPEPIVKNPVPIKAKKPAKKTIAASGKSKTSSKASGSGIQLKRGNSYEAPVLTGFQTDPTEEPVPVNDVKEAEESSKPSLPSETPVSVAVPKPFRRLSIPIFVNDSEPSVLDTEEDMSPIGTVGVPQQSVTWRNLFLREEAQVLQKTASLDAMDPKRAYDIRAADALEQFTLNMAVSLITSMDLLCTHRIKGDLDNIKMKAALDERRTLRKLAKIRGATGRAVNVFLKEKTMKSQNTVKSQSTPHTKTSKKASSKPVETGLSPTSPFPSPRKLIPTSPHSPSSSPRSPSSPRNASKPPKPKPKQSRRPSKQQYEKSAKRPEVDRNFLSSNIDFELRHIEMVRRLAGLEKSEGDSGMSVGQEGSEERQVQAEKEIDGKGEEKPWKNCIKAWEDAVLAEGRRSDVESMLQDMMRDKTLRDLLPFSPDICYSFPHAESSVTTLPDHGPLNPPIQPDLTLQQELALRSYFLRLCSQTISHDDLLSTQSGVFYQTHKDSFIPNEMRTEVREAVKKRRYREKVMKDRVSNRHVELRARVYTTFSGLPRSVRLHQPQSASEKLLIDGFAHTVNTDLERKERVYMRIKQAENLRKLSSTQGNWSEASLKAAVKGLQSLRRPQTRS